MKKILIATLRPGRPPEMHISPEEFGELVCDTIDADPALQEAVMAWERRRRELVVEADIATDDGRSVSA